MKPKLLFHPNYWCNLHTVFLEPVWKEHFDIEPIDFNKTYDPQTAAVFANYLYVDQWLQPWRDRGFKIIIDHLWDTWDNDGWESNSSQIVLRNLNWSWYIESLWYQDLGYQNYISNPQVDKSFLMLMNQYRPHRDAIYNQLQPILVDAIHSYHGQGVTLQNANDQPIDSPNWQRYTDPNWYNNTRFSLVVETEVTNSIVVHSEKSYKPMAFKHPTVSWGSPGLLQYLRNQGFETFDHKINETYDLIQNNDARLSAVVAEVTRLNQIVKQDPNWFNDTITKNKLEHNFNQFYNRALVLEKFKQEIIDPIKEYIA